MGDALGRAGLQIRHVPWLGLVAGDVAGAVWRETSGGSRLDEMVTALWFDEENLLAFGQRGSVWQFEGSQWTQWQPVSSK